MDGLIAREVGSWVGEWVVGVWVDSYTAVERMGWEGYPKG